MESVAYVYEGTINRANSKKILQYPNSDPFKKFAIHIKFDSIGDFANSF